MFHMQMRIGEDEDAALIVRRLDFELAGVQVRSIRHYQAPGAGSRSWFVVFRGVTAANWGQMRAIVDRVLRNHDCAYSLRPPTARPQTVASRSYRKRSLER